MLVEVRGTFVWLTLAHGGVRQQTRLQYVVTERTPMHSPRCQDRDADHEIHDLKQVFYFPEPKFIDLLKTCNTYDHTSKYALRVRTNS